MPLEKATPERQWLRLRGYAFDPGLSQQFKTAGISEIAVTFPWERIERGPVGDYVDVVVYDPASSGFRTRLISMTGY